MAKVDMVMPQMGESIAEGTVIKWLKKEGERVEKDEIILEISTDKVDSEIPSPEAGTVTKLLASEGETVKVGEVIAHIDTDGNGAAAAAEQPRSTSKQKASEAPATTEKEEVEAKKPEQPAEPEAKREPESEPEPEPEPEPVSAQDVKRERPPTDKQQQRAGDEPGTDGSKKFFSPLVRSIARAEGVSGEELERIEGTGANGRVTKNDILSYIKNRKEKQTEPAPRPAAAQQQVATVVQEPQAEALNDGVEVIPMNNMRKSIAAHMVNSVHTSPHVFAVSEADMSKLVKFRESHKDEFLKREGFKLTYMPFIIQASAQALRDFPMVNTSIQGDNILLKKYINVGVAVALEGNGLIVPVIKGADGMNILGLARVGNDLAQRARNRKLLPDEVQDGTFSITNMGSFGSLMGLPIINQPQVAILGVGVIKKRPVVINDAIAVRDMLYISLSFDHRIVDGALAGQFLEKIAYYLSNFDTENLKL